MKNKIYNFKNKNIVISGAFGSLGKHLVSQYLKYGANLYLTDLNTVKIKKKFNKQKIYYFNCDFEKISNVEKLVLDIKKKFKKVDILVNNAAIVGESMKSGWNTNFLNQSIEGWNKSYKINLLPVFFLIQKLIPILNSKESNIVNISSIYGTSVPNFQIYEKTNIFNPLAYSVSKAGIIYLTKWLAKLLGRKKIRVNTISPGGIFRNQNKKFLRNYIMQCPLGRMATEKDVVNSCLFLTSNEASYITGQNLIVDGGFTI